MTQTIEQLQAKNAELAAEVARLKATPPNQRQDLHCVVSDISAECRELRQQLAIAEAHNARLREALENHSGNYKLSKAECAVINDLLDKPASREALDAYVAEKVKELFIPVRIDYGDGDGDVAFGNDHQVRRLKKWLDKFFAQKQQISELAAELLTIEQETAEAIAKYLLHQKINQLVEDDYTEGLESGFGYAEDGVRSGAWKEFK